jgi:hypothetical protein
MGTLLKGTRMTYRILLLFFCLAGAAVFPQDSEIRTRQLWDTSLMSQRPAAPSAAAAPKQTKTPAAAPVRGLVGVTVWELRPSRSTDRRDIRALIQEDGRETEETPQRIPADSPLKEGQHVRISVESGEEGYLYLIDRDEYADGTKGEPYLIFPTKRTRGGDNHVKAGVVIQIPDAEDKPSYFKVERSRDDQVDEVISILVSPKPIPGLEIMMNRQKLRDDQMAGWEKIAQTKAYRLEAVGQAGKPLTVAEQEASRGGRALTQEDPLPQTMYHVDSKPGDSIMLRLPLKIVPTPK